MSTAEIIGYVAGGITSLTFLPQVVKTWKQKSAKDVSLLMFIIAIVNEILWIFYGVLENLWVIILTNIIMLVMSLIMVGLKLRYK